MKTRVARSTRLAHVDFIRVIAFACVVAVHLAGEVNDLNDVGWGAVSFVMHYARYAFICVTAFVLCYGYYRSDQPARVFYRRRFGQIVLPYLIWSAIYLAIRIAETPWRGPGGTLKVILVDTLTGDAWYHLYFLIITMQFYLVFPWFRRLLRRTEGRHGRLLAASWVVQLGYMAVVAWVPRPGGSLGQLWAKSYVLLPMYAGFVMLGALAAVHYRLMHDWVLAHIGLLWTVGIAGLAGSLAGYVFRVAVLDVPVAAARMAMHPLEALLSLAMILLLYLAGTAWLDRRDTEPLSTVVEIASVRAFGVYASHPFVIWVLGFWLTPAVLTAIPYALPRTVLLLLLTYVGALLVVEVLLRSPLSRLLVARERRSIRP